jgi:pilus assembly protein FimV
MGLSGTNTFALSLGRIAVQSGLGEPLRAEIDVPEISAEEAASLRATIASPDAYAAAKIEYNAALSGLQATLQRRSDGRAYIRLTTDRPINDPFVDMLVEATWSSGRILRDYTMLFDPPTMRKATPAPTLAQTAGEQTQRAQVTNPVAPPPAPAEVARRTSPNKSATAPSKPVTVPAPAVAAPPSDGKQITVKSGDTAGKIAAENKAPSVSLDQMLVALLRSNPDAFINNNINRIRSGAVLNVPSAEQAQAISKGEATQTILAQSKDFNEFRRNLATNAPAATVNSANRKASGTVETQVEVKKPASDSPDKLTLSKGSVKGKADASALAKAKAEKEAAERAAEINKNIDDLKKVGTASAPATATSAAVVASSAPTIAITSIAPASAPVATPSAPAEPAPSVSAPASAPVEPAPIASAPTPEPLTAPSAPVVAPPPPTTAEEPSFLDGLLSNEYLPALGGVLIALLAGVGFYRWRQHKKDAAPMDSSFLESRLQPDSFFGASGGQRVDTNNEGPVSGSSMVYSASQLDAADDVDPVAEADVYMAYGRDAQAEEILKEAVRTNPSRLAVHSKLLEIYAKRRDAKAYEATAANAYKITGGSSPDWVRICEMGLTIDPTNSMYQPGGTPAAPATAPVAASEGSGFGNTEPHPTQAEFTESTSGVDLDLDLDFSMDEQSPAQESSAAAAKSSEFDDMDFGLSEDAGSGDVPSLLPEISLSTDDSYSMAKTQTVATPSFTQTEPAVIARTPAPADNDGDMLEFDMDSLSLDLENTIERPTEAPENTTADPLETKLALAEEFVSIGDEDGARALIEEVMAEATGEMRAKAERALSNLS